MILGFPGAGYQPILVLEGARVSHLDVCLEFRQGDKHISIFQMFGQFQSFSDGICRVVIERDGVKIRQLCTLLPAYSLNAAYACIIDSPPYSRTIPD